MSVVEEIDKLLKDERYSHVVKCIKIGKLVTAELEKVQRGPKTRNRVQKPDKTKDRETT